MNEFCAGIVCTAPIVALSKQVLSGYPQLSLLLKIIFPL